VGFFSCSLNLFYQWRYKDGSTGGVIKSNLSRIPPNPQIVLNLALAIKTVLQNTPRRFADKLEQHLKSKERQNDEAMHREDTERLVTQIEMLRVVLRLVRRNMRTQTQGVNEPKDCVSIHFSNISYC
jgi:hypothetical protein